MPPALALAIGKFLAPLLDVVIDRLIARLEDRGVIAKPIKEIQEDANKANDPGGLLPPGSVS